LERTCAEVVIAGLKAEGVEVVFGIVGTPILDLLDALARTEGIRFIPAQHEQGVTYMADGYARVSGRPGVCLVTAGPGVTNAATGIAQAYHESSPVVLLSGDVASSVYGRGRSNFHEMDQVGLMRPITKFSARADRADRVYDFLRAAFRAATSGRQGPAYLGIPKDLLSQVVPLPSLPMGGGETLTAHMTSSRDQIEAALDLLLESKNPLIIAGGGVRWARARSQLLELAELLAIPVASTTWHRGIVPDDHPLGLGQFSNSGTRPALRAGAEADVIFFVGCTLSELTTDRYSYNLFSENTRMIHADIDPQEIGKSYPVEVGLVGHLRCLLGEMIELLQGRGVAKPTLDDHPRVKRVADWKAEWEAWLAELTLDEAKPIRRLTLFKAVREILDREAIVVAGGGGTAAYTRFAFPAYEPLLFPGDFSPMGSDYGLALGAKVACPDRQVVSLIGDGSFMMVLPEILTAVENGIATVVVIMHNDIYANVKYKQRTLYRSRYIGVDHPYPNFAEVARCFGAWGERVEEAREIKPAMERALTSGQPAVVDVLVDPADEIPPSDEYLRWIREHQMQVE